MPPDHIVRGALRVLFVAAVYTRNGTIDDRVSRPQLNDLWEAIHEIPDLLTRWPEDGETELLMYLREYGARWNEPDLEAAYQAEVREHLATPHREVVEAWSDGASVQVRATTNQGDPVDMTAEEARRFAAKIVAAADEAEAS